MIRVAVLSPAAELGGAERSLLTLLKAGRGVLDATVLLPKEGPLCRHLDAGSIPWIVVPQPAEILNLTRDLRKVSLPACLKAPFSVLGYLRRLRERIQTLRPDVVYSNGIKFHFLSSLLPKRLNIPIVWHVRDHWSGRILGLAADRCPEMVVANSRATAAKLQERMRRTHRVMVVHNAVDCDEFTPEGATADDGLRDAGEYRVGLPGPLAEIKGQFLFLDAAQQVLRKFPGARFFIVGGFIYDTAKDRAYEGALRGAIAARGLSERVTVTGFQESMAPWYRFLDVVVNASTIPEGFGRTLLEAMACGRAVVGPASGGIPEFVRHEETGLLYGMGEKDALADSVIRLLRDEALRIRLGREGRIVAVREFSAARHAEAMAALFVRAKAQFESRKSFHPLP